jgi:putative DNA primase/helicase
LSAVAGGNAPEDRIVINRAGWKRQTGGEWEYLIPPDTWREVCTGLDPGRVAAVLAKRSFLLGATERHKADTIRIVGHPRMRVYRVSAAILAGETDGK